MKKPRIPPITWKEVEDDATKAWPRLVLRFQRAAADETGKGLVLNGAELFLLELYFGGEQPPP